MLRFLINLFVGSKKSPTLTTSTTVKKVDALPKMTGYESKSKRPAKKRRTKAEIEAARKAESARVGEILSKNSTKDIQQLHAAGVKYFIWRSVCDQRTCGACRKLDGKRFKLESPPSIGYPGQHRCSDEEHCRCYAEADFKGTIFDIK